MSQVGPAQHPQHRFSQHSLGLSFQHGGRCTFFQAAGITGMPTIEFILPFVTRKVNLNNNNGEYTRVRSDVSSSSMLLAFTTVTLLLALTFSALMTTT
jgi:hypothetical protein